MTVCLEFSDILIEEGSLRFNFYTENMEISRYVDLKIGVTIVILSRGMHSLPHVTEVLEDDNTKYLEVEFGPFTEAERDKKRIFE